MAEWTQAIPWIISALLLILNFYNTKSSESEKEDTKFDGLKESLLKANMKLDQVCATTNETRADIKSLNNDLNGIDRRVAIVERDLKTAFNRIDELKGVNNHGKVDE